MGTCSVILRGCFVEHCFPPVGLGMRHTGGPHKCHAWAHQHRLECESWFTTQGLIGLYISMALDDGPERNIRHMNVKASDLFPYWPDAVIGDADGFGYIGMEADADVRLCAHHMLIIPGTYHCIERIEQRLLAQFAEIFKEVKAGLESACTFMHYSYTRNHYKDTLRGDRLAWEIMFDSGPPPCSRGGACGASSWRFRAGSRRGVT